MEKYLLVCRFIESTNARVTHALVSSQSDISLEICLFNCVPYFTATCWRFMLRSAISELSCSMSSVDEAFSHSHSYNEGIKKWSRLLALVVCTIEKYQAGKEVILLLTEFVLPTLQWLFRNREKSSSYSVNAEIFSYNIPWHSLCLVLYREFMGVTFAENCSDTQSNAWASAIVFALAGASRLLDRKLPIIIDEQNFDFAFVQKLLTSDPMRRLRDAFCARSDDLVHELQNIHATLAQIHVGYFKKLTDYEKRNAKLAQYTCFSCILLFQLLVNFDLHHTRNISSPTRRIQALALDLWKSSQFAHVRQRFWFDALSYLGHGLKVTTIYQIASILTCLGTFFPLQTTNKIILRRLGKTASYASPSPVVEDTKSTLRKTLTPTNATSTRVGKTKSKHKQRIHTINNCTQLSSSVRPMRRSAILSRYATQHAALSTEYSSTSSEVDSDSTWRGSSTSSSHSSSTGDDYSDIGQRYTKKRKRTQNRPKQRGDTKSVKGRRSQGALMQKTGITSGNGETRSNRITVGIPTKENVGEQVKNCNSSKSTHTLQLRVKRSDATMRLASPLPEPSYTQNRSEQSGNRLKLKLSHRILMEHELLYPFVETLHRFPFLTVLLDVHSMNASQGTSIDMEQAEPYALCRSWRAFKKKYHIEF